MIKVLTVQRFIIKTKQTEGNAPFQRSSLIQEKIKGVQEVVKRTPTHYFNIFFFFFNKVKGNAFFFLTSSYAPKFGTMEMGSVRWGVTFSFY